MKLLALIAFLPFITYAGTERTDLNTRIEADVISKDKDGNWTASKAVFDKFSDARIIVCVETVNSVVADCILISDDNEVTLRPLRMLEEKI